MKLKITIIPFHVEDIEHFELDGLENEISGAHCSNAHKKTTISIDLDGAFIKRRERRERIVPPNRLQYFH